MNKQPLLTSFPTTILATAKRRVQAEVKRVRELVMEGSLSGYGVLFGDVLSPEYLGSIDPTQRQRLFGHIPTFWAWLAQILEGNASCGRALALLQSWYRVSGSEPPAGDTSSYCQARGRIDTAFLESVGVEVQRKLRSEAVGVGLWEGLTIKAIDGTSVSLMDTPANQLAYPQPTTQKEGCGFPIMGIGAVLNLSHGGWDGFATAPQSSHDAAVAPRLLGHIGEGDLLMGDRAYCSYEIFATVAGNGGHSLMRLHQKRHAKLDWRRGKKVGKNERIVTWSKPKQPAGSTLSPWQWEALPDKMEIRYMRIGFEDRHGRKRMLVIATTLLDTDRYDGDDLCDLYAERWDIEVRFRDFKTILRMERFEVRTPEMAHKTLQMVMIAYNLMRLLMGRAAEVAGVRRERLSFKGTADLLNSTHESFRAVAGMKRKAVQWRDDLVDMLAQRTVPYRPFRLEPRATKRRPKSYERLTKPRHEFVENPHRSKPRNAA